MVPLTLLKLHLLLPGFALVMFRILGLMVTAPLFGSSVIPVRLKVAMAMTIAALLFPVVGPTLPADITLSTALVGVFGEMLIGLIIGLSMTLVLNGVQLTGMMIGQQAGIGLASVVDPTQNTQSTVVGQVYMITTMLIFLAIGGHRMLIRALLDTFGVIPVLSFGFGENMMGLVVNLLTASYILAIKLFAPVMIALLLTTVAMGFLSRTIPQLNILSVGFAVRSMASLGVAALALGASQELLVTALLDTLDAIRGAFGLAPLGG